MIHASCLAWSATATDAEQLSSAITVRVANRAGIPPATIVKMQSESEWVMGKAGISIKWVDCPFSTEAADPGSPCGGTLGGTVFLVRITSAHVPNQGRIWDTTLGFTRITPDGGSYATVLIDRVEELAREQQVVSKGQILGYAVAHELGHILMCSTSHPPRGLMRAGWKANELRDMAQRRLLFSAEEAERMRGRITGILHH